MKAFYKIVSFLFLLTPLTSYAQFSISGRLLNQADTKPVANASVFLNNTTIGDKTGADGTFMLHNIKPGKYELVISFIGFETYHQNVTVTNAGVNLPDIIVFPKTTQLNEVKVTYKKDPNRENYLNLFTDEFLGTSEIAKSCKIINPQILDLDYDDATKTLKASSVDFLEIENDALGYKIRYLLTDFMLKTLSPDEKRVYYAGAVSFEQLKGSPADARRWKQTRLEVYANSPMHFLRSALADKLGEEGFRVLQLADLINPERPPESLINAKIAYFKALRTKSDQSRDSLSFWLKKSKLPKTLEKLNTYPLNKQDIIQPAAQDVQYKLDCENDGLYVSYNKDRHFRKNDQLKYLYNAANTENTLIKFNQPDAFFNSNGVITNPYSVVFYGVWGRNRVAELLPINYDPPQVVSAPQLESLPIPAVASLTHYLATYITEKAYLHFDKPYYAAGDTIYFKAYVTKGPDHKLSDLSGVLHTDLIDADNKVVRAIKLKLDSGIASGDFALPDSLPQGNYRVRAYTQLMRNTNPAGCFEKIIPIGSAQPVRVPESLIKQQEPISINPDIQFLPEGGRLIAGVRSKIAFKAIGSDGLGIDVKGVIVDNHGIEIVSFSSVHLGMGSFYLTPEDGKTYTAKINYPGGENVVNLPAPGNGIGISVNNEAPEKAVITISASKIYYQSNKGKVFTLVVSLGGRVVNQNYKLDHQIITADVLKGELPSGVADVTLLSSSNEPLCERLLYVQHAGQLNLSIDNDKRTFKKRGAMHILLRAKSHDGVPAQGNFSAAVINESLVPGIKANDDNIISRFLLTSDLKGYIEQPGYYFSDSGSAVRSNLDLLMLTQGYRQFEWKKVLDSTHRDPVFQPEKGIRIGGQVTNLSGKPVANGAVNLVTADNGVLETTATNAKGLFSFTNLAFTDSAHFVLSAVNDKNRNTTKITCFNDKRDAPPVLPYQQLLNRPLTDSGLSAYVRNDKLQQREAANYLKSNGIVLKEVNIRSKKPDNEYRTQSLAGPGNADQVVHAKELGYGPLTSKLNGLLRGVFYDGDTAYLTINNNGMGKNFAKKMLVIVDGLEHGDYKYLQANEVESIEVLRYASAAIYGMEGAGGVLIITTKANRGLDPKEISAIGILPITVPGFYKTREFYSPKYNHPDDNLSRPDLRSTIYWKPEIQTDKDGNAFFEYYNADGTGDYRVVIEGIDDKGNLGRQVYRYKVE